MQPSSRESDWLICSEQPETSKSVERKRALPRFERKRSWPAVKARVSPHPWAALIGELAQPLRLARELTVAGFIRGSLHERVGNHAFSLGACYGHRVAASAVPA